MRAVFDGSLRAYDPRKPNGILLGGSHGGPRAHCEAIGRGVTGTTYSRSSEPTVERISCPLCSGERYGELGEVFHSDPPTVAGVSIKLPAGPYHLLSCRNCGLAFKWPRIPDELLATCYREAPGDHWVADIDPVERRIAVIEETLRHYTTPGRILDIGCFNGAVLDHFSDHWRKYGIEPSIQAAERARRRGIDVLAATIEELAAPDFCFETVIALDVLEHLNRPMPFLECVRKLLTPRGVFLAFTGDSHAPTWRAQGGHYWYCSLPEHVTFFNRKAIHYVAEKLEMDVVFARRMSHVCAPVMQRCWELGCNLVYDVVLAGRGLGIQALRRLSVYHRAPHWVTAPDHILFCLRPR